MLHRISKILLIASVFVVLTTGVSRAEDRYVFWGFDGGFSWALGEGSDLWESGTTFGINVLYPLHAHLAIGGRLGFNRWRPNNEAAAEMLLPPGSTLLNSDTRGEFNVFVLTPVIRATSGALVGERLAGFAQMDVGLYHVSFDAETAIEYQTGTQTQVDVASANGSDNRFGMAVGAGLSLTFSKDSRLELYPAYNAIFENDGTTEFVSLLIAFRIEFSPWDEE